MFGTVERGRGAFRATFGSSRLTEQRWTWEEAGDVGD